MITIKVSTITIILCFHPTHKTRKIQILSPQQQLHSLTHNFLTLLHLLSMPMLRLPHKVKINNHKYENIRNSKRNSSSNNYKSSCHKSYPCNLPTPPWQHRNSCLHKFRSLLKWQQTLLLDFTIHNTLTHAFQKSTLHVEHVLCMDHTQRNLHYQLSIHTWQQT